MALISYKRGQASIILRVKLLDSTVTTGAGKTGLTLSTAGLRVSTIADNESGPTAYTQAGSTIETITTLGTYATPTASKCRFKEVAATQHPGVYEIQLADARYAVTSAKSLLVSVNGAAGMAQCDAVIPLTDADPYDVVRQGITALPNSTILAALYAGFETGTAQAGGASSITLRSGASAVNNIYNDQVAFISSGTGSGQSNRILSYDGTTKIATVETAWATQPDSTSVYVVLGRVG